MQLFLFFEVSILEIYVYSDESGVFDVKHYDTFVFSGLVFTDIQTRDSAVRRLLSLEKKLRNKEVYKNTPELKDGKISRRDRELLYTTVNTYIYCVFSMIFLQIFFEIVRIINWLLKSSRG